MGNDFKTLLRESRDKKRVSQSDLADMLNCSRAIISSWEDGFALPSRENIIRVSISLKLNPGDVDNLLMSASYIKLSGSEVVDIVNSNMLSQGIGLVNRDDLSNFFNSTGMVIGGTMGSLDAKVFSIEKMLGEISGSMLDLKTNQNANMVKEIEKRLEPVTKEVKSIREEIVPQLEATQSNLTRSDEFIRKNADFFISAVEGDGVIKVISNQVESINKRLGSVESQLNVSKDRAVAFVSVIIAVISACIALCSLAVLFYTSFVRLH